jgi:hypothetical protein
MRPSSPGKNLRRAIILAPLATLIFTATAHASAKVAAQEKAVLFCKKEPKNSFGSGAVACGNTAATTRAAD